MFTIVSAVSQYVVLGQALASDAPSVERGRYLIELGFCNDCHTTGYIDASGNVEESLWLAGNPVGFRGPWGTTYGSNLRRYLEKLTEDQWVKIARVLQTRPPMPWFVLHDMEEKDLRSVYRYVKHLGPPGQEAPAFVPPGRDPQGRYLLFPGR